MTPSTTTHQSPTTLLSYLTTSSELGIYAAARFGIPSKNCVGLGICQLELIPSVQALNKDTCSCNRARVFIQRESSDRLSFLFEKASLSLPTIQQHFSSRIFVIQEAYILSTIFLKPLGIPNYVLQPGSYPIIERKKYYQIIF